MRLIKKSSFRKICSYIESEPEGIFKIQQGYGIIEVSFIGYLFDKNYEINKK